MTKIAEKEIVKIVRKTVLESLRGVFADSDYGLELSAVAKQRLLEMRKSKTRTIPFSEIKKKYL